MSARRSLIALLVFFCVLIFVAVVFVLVFVGRAPEVKEGSYLVLSLGGDIPEESSGYFDMPFLEKEQVTVKTLLECLEKAKVDRRIDGIVVKIMPFSFGWSKANEIREKLAWFKANSKKPVVAYMVLGGDKEYALATVCDRVLMPEEGELFLDGLVSEVMFLRGMLDKMGVVPDLEHIGAYKSASDMLTQRTFTEAHREVTNSILDDGFERLLGVIAEAKGLSPAEVRKIVDSGPYTAAEAYKAGLVDSLLYEDELPGALGVENENRFKTVSLEDYARVKSSTLKLGRGPKIALVYAVGTITEGKSSFSPIWGRTLGSDTMVEALKDAARDGDIKAIVLRIDSPGGSGLASDFIWREVNRAKARKPFIASMSDVAGSGGYYIAMAADTIVAEPGTITGSIGVVSGKFATAGLYSKLGVNREIVTRGERAAMFSDVRAFTPAERRKLLERLWEFYTSFVRKAAQGRGMTEEEVDKVGRGRVWTGAQAAEIGLVDVLGGLDESVELAKARAGIPKESEVTLVVFPKRKISMLQKLVRAFSAESHETFETSLGVFAPGGKEALEMIRAGSLFYPGESLYMMPYRIETR
jgi:protease-4